MQQHDTAHSAPLGFADVEALEERLSRPDAHVIADLTLSTFGFYKKF